MPFSPSESRHLAASDGYFYRRKKGRHLNVDTGPKDAEIYYCVKVHGKRYATCMHTTNLALAKQRARRFPRGITLTCAHPVHPVILSRPPTDGPTVSRGCDAIAGVRGAGFRGRVRVEEGATCNGERT